MRQSDRNLKLLGLFFLAFTLFNFPLILLFSGGQRFLGIPALLWYLFLVWALIIFFTARIVEKHRPLKNKK